MHQIKKLKDEKEASSPAGVALRKFAIQTPLMITSYSG
jgi:hypothetical protein